MIDEQRFLELFPNASRATVAANCPPRHPADRDGDQIERAAKENIARRRADLERSAGDGALGEGPKKNGNPKRVLVRVTSVRKRPVDDDNLCEKYVVDCCRYAGLISNDNPAAAQIESRCRKAEKGESEYTIVEIFEIAED